MKVKAKFTNNTKQKIYERDWWCIICWISTWILQFHHIFFWRESNYSKFRNEFYQWVCLCNTHHMEVHSCSVWEWVRQKCIDYIINKSIW